MEHSTIIAKITSFFEENLFEDLPRLIEEIAQGGLYGFEEKLSLFIGGLYNLIAEELLVAGAQASLPLLRAKAKKKRLGKLEERPMQVQVKTGHYVTVMGLYARKAPPQYKGPRHLLRSHWHLIKGASPAYYSNVGMLCVLCPSFEVAGQVLEIHNVAYNRERLRDLTHGLAKRCAVHQPGLSLAPQETLQGKRVVIGVDGGRCRCREYNGGENGAGNPTYDTPWKEPKMFVIDILDDEGNIDRARLPLYGCRFGDDELVDLLASYLEKLEVHKAEQVQVLADGAPWIWNRLKPMLIGLGVAEDKIIESVDYYHASQYIHKIIEGLPRKHIAGSGKMLKAFKEWLWQGKIENIVEKCEELFLRPGKEIKRYVGYLQKNEDRMQYADYQANKLMCGSGIIESGIRRIINLRFKNSSAFWKQENVERLFFLRGILLSFRWKTMMNNLVKLPY